MVEVVRGHIDVGVVTEDINEGVTSVGPEESIDHVANLLVSGFGFDLNDWSYAVHRAFGAAGVVVVCVPKSVGLPLDGVVEAQFSFVSFAQAENAELV